MGIFAIINAALRIARTHKSLWLFGFMVGAGVGFNNGGGGGDQSGVPAASAASPAVVALVVGVGVLVLIGLVMLKFVSTGALIEGVKRARGNSSLTVREGFREGWAHWGVLLRIALIFLAAAVGSAAVLFGGCYAIAQAFGGGWAMAFTIVVALLIGAPLFVTLHMWHAFAERIAVLENRRAFDAVGKARLFLHGRLSHGLKLVVASFLGVLTIVALALVVIAPVILLLRASAGLWGILPAVAVGVLIVLPTAFVAISMIGIMVSSVWTLGYLQQVER